MTLAPISTAIINPADTEDTGTSPRSASPAITPRAMSRLTPITSRGSIAVNHDRNTNNRISPITTTVTAPILGRSPSAALPISVTVPAAPVMFAVVAEPAKVCFTKSSTERNARCASGVPRSPAKPAIAYQVVPSSLRTCLRATGLLRIRGSPS
ncbi:Uncharacterised protein [Mycobacteroides abscessus subsp. abscessus]|nr:Uncharacterised protein [Mycobacteroides abscessus subsp. abscessus]